MGRPRSYWGLCFPRNPVAEFIARLHPPAIFLGGERVLIGYVRVSKSAGTLTLGPQRDVLLAASVVPDRIYEDLASRRGCARPNLTACLKMDRIPKRNKNAPPRYQRRS